MEEIRNKLAAIVLEVVPNAVVDNEAAFGLPFREIGVDSLESMNVLLAVQEQFGVNIPDEDFNVLNTLNQVVEYVQARKG